MPENYTHRLAVKTHEQLEREARELKIQQEEERLAAEAASSPLNSMLSFFGLSSAGTTLAIDDAEGGDPAGQSKGGNGDDSGSDSGLENDEDLHPLDPRKRLKNNDEMDKRPLQMAVPVLAAFKHLTAVASRRAMVQEIPADYDDSTAVFASYDQARPMLKEHNQDFVYQSMVHKIRESGGPSRVRFEAAAFNLKEYNENKNKPKYKSEAPAPEDFDDSNSAVSGSQQGDTAQHEGGELRSTLISASSTTLQKIVPKYQRSVTVIAKPAFVIKSRRTKDGKEKVFINVLHHPTFDELVLSGVISVEPYEEPLTGLGDSFVTRDKDGAKAAVYNVLIASSYVKTSFRKYEKRITEPQFVKMVRNSINCGLLLFFTLAFPFSFNFGIL